MTVRKIKIIRRLAPVVMVVTVCFLATVPAYSVSFNSAQERVTPAAVTADLLKPELWIMLLTTSITGAMGGAIYELINHEGKCEMPSWMARKVEGQTVERILNLGAISRIFIGAFAAIASLLFLSPSNTMELIAMGVIVGSIGTSVFRSMQDRITMMLAVKEADETRERAEKADKRVTEAIDKLQSRSSERVAENLGTPTSGKSSGVAEDLGVMQLLQEAHGLYQSIQKS